jgi:non-ribosomal peptide synthase protein (TIGR01720 family)
MQALETTFGQSLHVVEIESSARDTGDAEVDLARTVGCMDVRFPVVLQLPPAAGPGEALTAIKDQIRAVPDGGLGYGMLRYLAQDAENSPLRAFPPPSIGFALAESLGDALPPQVPIALVDEGTIQPSATARMREQRLELRATARQGRYHFTFCYCRNIHQPATIGRLAQDFLNALHALIAHCSSGEAGGFTASDFPAARASQEDLARLLSQLGSAGQGGKP